VFENTLGEKSCASIDVVELDDRELSYILLHPHSDQAQQQEHLIVFVHGGPHSSTDTQWSRLFDIFLRVCKSSVLAINYTGSLGGRHMDRLLGKIGELDVQNCIDCVEDVKRKRKFVSVSLFGGSHGMSMNLFLAAFLFLSKNLIFKVDSLELICPAYRILICRA
jgi:dipeptidyl aminopeptidase/acylaminoacyl peptidase